MNARTARSSGTRRTTLALALGLAVAAADPRAAASQVKPDFSGEWTLAAEPGGQRDVGFGSGWGRSITIEQDADVLTVLWPIFSRGDLQPPLRFTYALDGSPTTATIMMGRGVQEPVSRASWQGADLVITTVHTFRHPEDGRRATSQVTRTLSLESPASLVVTTTIDGAAGRPARTSRVVYARR